MCVCMNVCLHVCIYVCLLLAVRREGVESFGWSRFNENKRTHTYVNMYVCVGALYVCVCVCVVY